MTAYATPAEVRAQPGMESANQDTVLSVLLDAATEAVNNFCNRPDGFIAGNAVARTFHGSGGAVQHFNDEAAAITLVEVKQSVTDTAYTAWSSNDWIAFSGDEMDPNFYRLPYTALMVAPTGAQTWFTSGRYDPFTGWRTSRKFPRTAPTVRVTAQWGYALTVPAVVKQACVTQAARWFKLGSGFWADAIANPDFGQLLYRKPLDPAVQFMLEQGRLIRPAIG